MLAQVSSFFSGTADFVNSHEPLFTALFTLALAFFTWLLAKRTGELWKAGEGQIKVAAKSAEAAMQSAKVAQASAEALVSSERAHVFVVIDSEDMNKQIKKVVDDTKAVMKTKDGNFFDVDIELKYAFKNFGRTPAILKRSFHDLRPVLAPEEERYQRNPELPPQWVIASGATSEFVRCRFSGQLTALQGVDCLFYFTGSVVYSDIFGGFHRHRFAWQRDEAGGQFTRLDEEEVDADSV